MHVASVQNHALTQLLKGWRLREEEEEDEECCVALDTIPYKCMTICCPLYDTDVVLASFEFETRTKFIIKTLICTPECGK